MTNENCSMRDHGRAQFFGSWGDASGREGHLEPRSRCFDAGCPGKSLMRSSEKLRHINSNSRIGL